MSDKPNPYLKRHEAAAEYQNKGCVDGLIAFPNARTRWAYEDFCAGWDAALANNPCVTDTPDEKPRDLVTVPASEFDASFIREAAIEARGDVMERMHLDLLVEGARYQYAKDRAEIERLSVKLREVHCASFVEHGIRCESFDEQITQLRAENARLRAALERIADDCDRRAKDLEWIAEMALEGKE